MNKEVEELKDRISKLSYNEKCQIYTEFFDLGGITSMNITNRMILISLVAFVTNQMRKKDPSITCYDALKKIVKPENLQRNSRFEHFIEGLSIVIENFMYSCDKFDACGLKTSQDIVNRIKELLDEWLPF